MPVRPRVRYCMGSLPVVVGTGWMPYAVVSGNSFQKYTEIYSGYASGGDVVSQDRTQAGVSSPGSAEPGGGEPTPRRRRADARRNVDALIEAARTVFATSGVDAPAKEITDLAGVGVGTLYRHFPRRSDLIVAVLQHEIDECIDAAEVLGTTLSPWEALMGWIERLTDFVGTKRGLASALHSDDPAYGDLPQHLLDRLEPALQTLLARAVDGGYARDDVTAREVLTTIALICQPVRSEQPS